MNSWNMCYLHKHFNFTHITNRVLWKCVVKVLRNNISALYHCNDYHLIKYHIKLESIVWKMLRYRVQRPNNLRNIGYNSAQKIDRLSYLGVGQRMIHETNATHHLSCFANMGGTIRWITEDLFTFCSFVAWPNAGNLARLIKYNLVNWFVQHVGASVDRAESGKTLRQFS